MFPRTLTTLILSLTMALGTQIFMPADASAKPGSILVKSRESGKRTHKGRRTTSSKSKKSSKKSSRSSSDRRVVRSTRTAPTTRRTTTTRPSSRTTSTRRTVRNVRPRTTTHRTRTVHHSRPRGQRVRRTYYRSGSSRHTTHRHTTHHHSSHHTTHTRSSSRSGRTHGRATTEPYVTGGLGISGFASDAIVDGALPGIGYNLAVGAKGKLFGAELGLNGGGYTFDPANASADLGVIGLSGDLKLQPSIDFFEPYAAIGIGGYALNDAIINQASAGVGLRLGAGADFRFDSVALRVSYQFGLYGFGNDSDAYGGDFGAKTETLGASLVVYF